MSRTAPSYTIPLPLCHAFCPPLRPSALPCASITRWTSGRPGSHCAMREAGLFDYGPRLFERHRAHTLQDSVGDFWTAVGEALAFPPGCT
jgi:hypothetical protein